MIDRISKQVDQRNRDMLLLLEKMVNIDSGSDNPDGIEQVAQIIGEKLSEMGFTVEYPGQPGVCTHVLARKAGTSGKSIMIIGHTDTVFSKGTVKKRPFTVIGDKAYGPGVLDMKSGIVIALFALEALYQEGWNEKNLTVFFCGDEEDGHPKTNARELFMSEAKGKNAVFNMETGSDSGAVVIARKGLFAPQITVRGKAAHAGKDPQKGASAILELAYKTTELHKLTDYEEGITYNVGVVNGGTASNVVAGEAYAKVDIRFVKQEQYEKALADLKRVAAKIYVEGTETTVSNEKVRFMPMENTAEGKELFSLVREQGRRLGIVPDIQAISVGGSSDSCWTCLAGAPTVCGMGARGELNHSEREYIYIDSLKERSKLLALSIAAV